MSKKAWSPGRMIRSEKTWGCGLQRSPRHRVDVVDVLRAEVEQVLRDVGHQLALADPRLELLGDQLVGAVDHGARGVEQDDLVDRLDLAGVEHDLLRVADGQALGLERGEHRRLDDVHAERHVDDALGAEDLADLAGGRAEQAGIRCDGAAQPDHPGVDVLRAHPRAVEAMVLRGRAEVPDVRVAAARQQGVAGHLVARPLADVGARDVADVVEVEQQDGADVGRRRAPRGRVPADRFAGGRRSSVPPSRHSSSRAKRRQSSSGTPVLNRCRAASESGRCSSMLHIDRSDASPADRPRGERSAVHSTSTRTTLRTMASHRMCNRT